MKRREATIGLAVATLAGLALLVTANDVDTKVRLPVVLAFLMLAPGLPFAARLPLASRVDVGVVAVALSLALDTAVAVGMLLTERWSPIGGLAALSALAIGGAVLPTRSGASPDRTAA